MVVSLKGPQGVQGTPGTALGCALVFAEGTVVDASRSFNVVNANGTRPATGVYCFNNLPFTPRNVMVIPERLDAGGTVVASGTTRGTAACPGSEQATVFLANRSDGAAVNNSFLVLFN
jgi:hypothetical protein